MSEPFWRANLILEVRCGSRAYGLDTPQSDEDTRGVCIPPKRYLLGLERFEQHVSPSGDHVVYALEKFVRLALDANPNIVETLFTEPPDLLRCTPAGQRLRDVRERTLSRRVGERFMGYALDQLQRMQRHHRWLRDPPAREPVVEDFGARSEAGKLRWPSAQQQKEYKAAHKKWLHYQRWRRERNPARAALEAAHGYDTKHAMHLCRLLTMGEEILTGQGVIVRRPDAAWLRSIREGALSYEELLTWAGERTARLAELRATSPLPEEPDREGLEALLIELQEEHLFPGA